MSINVGVIGTGNIGQDHIRRITHTLAGARVVALTDIDSSWFHAPLRGWLSPFKGSRHPGGYRCAVDC